MAADTGTLILDVDGNLKPLKGRLGKMAKSYRMKLDDKSFTQPLGRISGKLGEFDKSLDASNARVVAFGASAGAIYAVQKALTETVKAAISVEKTLADINVILGVSNKSLAQFSDKLFKVAGQTGSSFQSVAEAATELARQGLSVEQTLKRTNDALILTRLSGMNAASSVETLTAAINSFSKSALTSTEIINKMANVDAAFAVSTNDLAEALRRVGSTASDANVSFDELVAAVTSAQQVTARGGAVIGNSFKTIFTRLQRPKVLQQLEMLGIATKDLAGETKPVIQILQALAKQYDRLGSSQKSQITELIGGVFQINVVKAALSDLGKEYSIYDRALQTSVNSTDEAIRRNEKLNETLSALINKTFANLQKSAAGIGEGIFGPSMRSFMEVINKGLDGGDADGEGMGNKIGKGIFKGIENVISGPGMMLAFSALVKIIGRLGATTGDAFKTLVLQTKETKQREGFEKSIETRLRGQKDLMNKILNDDISVKDAHKVIADNIRTENEGLDLQVKKVKEISQLLRESGSLRYSETSESLVLTGGKKGKGRKAGGLVPDQQERKLARQGGYTAGLTKTTNIGPGQSVISNTRETEKRFPGMKQKAIMPPPGSRAADNYKKEFWGTHGFDPYASSGFIPNYISRRKTPLENRLQKSTKNLKKANTSKAGLNAGDFPAKSSKTIKKTFGQLQGMKGAYNFSRKAIGAKYYKGKMIDAADNEDSFSFDLKFHQHKDSLGKLRKKGMDWRKWESAVNRTYGAKAKGPSNYSVDGVKTGGNVIESKFLSNIGKINSKSVGPGYYMSKMLSHKIASTRGKYSMKDNDKVDNTNLGSMTVVSPFSRSYKNVATGFIPQFASKSDSELKPLIRSRLQSGSVQGFNNERWMGIVNSDPALRGMYDTVVSSNKSRDASKRAGVTSRAATAAAQPKLSTIFLKNLESVDMKKSAIAGYGFSSKMPNAKKNFQNSFKGRYPKMVKGIGYDMFKTMPGANPASTKKMMSQFNVHALDPAAQGQVSGRVFESFIKAMSKQVRKGRETGREKIDMSRHRLGSRYKGLFSKGPASKLGHFGSEIRYGGLTSRKAMQKQGFAGGFVPNFSAVGRAMETERMMGGDPEFREWPFPHVADKSKQKDFRSVLRDHPNLAGDARKSKEMQQSMLGAAGGHVPNYIAGAGMGLAKTAGKSGLIQKLWGAATSSAKGDGMGKALGFSMLIPQITGMVKGMTGEGNKFIDGTASATSSLGAMGVAAATMDGKMKAGALAVTAFTGLADILKIANDNSVELDKKVQELTENLTKQINSGQQYLNTQERLVDELSKPQSDQKKITKLNEQLATAMSGLSSALQAELIGAQNSTEAREALEKANVELANKTKQAANIKILESLRKGTTFGGFGVGGTSNFFGEDDTTKNFAKGFVGDNLSKLSEEQRGNLIKDIKSGEADLDGSKESIVKYLTETIGLNKEYANTLPENATALKAIIALIRKETQEEIDKRKKTEDLLRVTKPYTDQITAQNKAIKRAELELGKFNETLLALSSNVFQQRSFLAQFNGDVEAGKRKVGLSAARGQLETMRPFTGEKTMARGGFMLDRAAQQEGTFGKVRALNTTANKTIESIFKKMGKAALGQQTSGGGTQSMESKKKLSDYQLGLGNLASSGLRGENLSNAIDKLNTGMFGQRGQIPPGMSALKAELIDSDMKSRQELAVIAKESMEQKRILEDQYKVQLKQIKLQEDTQLGGSVDAWQSGGGGMMTQMAKRMNMMRFAKKTGNVELGGRMALGLNQNIQQLTGKSTTFGRDLAIRGRELGTRRNLSLAGRAMGGDAGRFILGQRGRAREGAIASIDSKIKPERGLDGIKRATAASGMQMRAMAPALKTAFVQALNGANVAQTLKRINQTMVRMAHLQSGIKGGRSAIDGLTEASGRAVAGAGLGNNAGGYVPNFAGVMMNNQEKLVRNYRQKMEKAKVQSSGAYSAGQKGAAVPRWVGGFNSKNDAILNPGMMAGGYVPNFAANYFKRGQDLTGPGGWQKAIDILKNSKGVTNPYQTRMNRRRIKQMHQMALKAGRPELIQQLQFASGQRFGGMMGGNRGGRLTPSGGTAPEWGLDWDKQLWKEAGDGHLNRTTKNRIRVGPKGGYGSMGGTLNRGADYYKNAGFDLSPRKSMMSRVRGGAGRAWQHAAYRGGRVVGKAMGASAGATSVSANFGQSFHQAQSAKYAKGGSQALGGMGSRAAHYGRYAGTGLKFGGRLLGGAAALVSIGDLAGKGLGYGTEALVGRKVSDDDKRVFGGWGDVATDFTGLSSIARSGKAIGGIASNDIFRKGDDKNLRRKTTRRMANSKRHKMSTKEFKEYKRQLAKNAASEKADPGFWGIGAANGYIPNFAGYGQGQSFSGLFGGAAKQLKQQQWKDSQDFNKFGAPGMGHMFKSQNYGAAMNTPGLRGEMLRRMGVTGGEAFKTYPKVGSFYADGHVPNFSGGIAASQARERRQSGSSDVYTKMIKGFGPATFNGSERGMEESIVRNHPNPRNAGMAEGHIPNFANLSKDLKSVSENIGLLNENMSMSGGDSGGQTNGNLSISMGEMRVSLYGGNPSQDLQTSLTDQLAVFQNEVQSTLSAMAPDTYAAMKGPPVV
jgi:TP901 family phage tail tape measure protein